MKQEELNREYKARFQKLMDGLGRVPTFKESLELTEWYKSQVELTDIKEPKPKVKAEKAMPERVRRSKPAETVVEASDSNTREDSCKQCGNKFTQVRKRGKPWTKCEVCR